MQAGDVVRMKSGGPKMTISWIENGDAYCEWFDGAANKGAKFSLTSLEK
ncbi:YodC family protein [Brevundimonas intermedia]